MEAVRFLIQGPSDGTTWVVAIPATSIAIPLDQLPLQGLSQKIAAGSPLMLQGEGASGATIYYRWAQASGVVNELALSTSTGIANQVGGMKIPGQMPFVGEVVPVSTTHLVAKVPVGAPTGILRIWAP